MSNSWTHFAFQFNGKEVAIYTNGVLAKTDSSTLTSPITAYTTPTGIGSCGGLTPGDSGHLGYKDEVRIYDGTVTAARVAADYANVASTDFITLGTVAENAGALPQIKLAEVTNITASSATVGGTLLATGGSAVSAWIEWGTSPDALTSATAPVTASDAGASLNFTLSGLAVNRTYYYRFKAANLVGTNTFAAIGSFFTTYSGTTAWTGAGTDNLWLNDDNWSVGAPKNTSTVGNIFSAGPATLAAGAGDLYSGNLIVSNGAVTFAFDSATTLTMPRFELDGFDSSLTISGGTVGSVDSSTILFGQNYTRFISGRTTTLLTNGATLYAKSFYPACRSDSNTLIVAADSAVSCSALIFSLFDNHVTAANELNSRPQVTENQVLLHGSLACSEGLSISRNSDQTFMGGGRNDFIVDGGALTDSKNLFFGATGGTLGDSYFIVTNAGSATIGWNAFIGDFGTGAHLLVSGADSLLKVNVALSLGNRVDTCAKYPGAIGKLSVTDGGMVRAQSFLMGGYTVSPSNVLEVAGPNSLVVVDRTMVATNCSFFRFKLSTESWKSDAPIRVGSTLTVDPTTVLQLDVSNLVAEKGSWSGKLIRANGGVQGLASDDAAADLSKLRVEILPAGSGYTAELSLATDASGYPVIRADVAYHGGTLYLMK